MKADVLKENQNQNNKRKTTHYFLTFFVFQDIIIKSEFDQIFNFHIHNIIGVLNMAKSKKITVGSQVVIPAGSKVTTRGTTVKRQSDTVVTVRNLETTRTGNLAVEWKSNGYKARTVLKAQ